ncbi:LysR family transcriptional regulator [Rhodobacteraceae bacterium D3-12]|nr:LysR family transcriptional regulator [Rhodobacteraceae bacterium D3-12]
MLSFRQLEVFRAVMINGSISAAANQLGIAQPTVTNTIRRLEDVLDTTLFDRTGARLKPTTIARQVFEASTTTMSAFERLSETVLEVVRGQHSTFRMGVSPSVSQALGPRSLALFSRQRPEAKLRMDTLSMKQIRDYLWLSEGNCAVTIFPVDHPGIASFRISSIGMVCVVPDDHALAEKPSVSVHDIADERLIFFHPNTPHGKLVRQIFFDAGLQPNISIETRFTETAPHLMREGFGIALQDELTGLGVHSPGYRVIPIAETLRQPVLFHCHANQQNDPDVRTALKCVRQAIDELSFPDEFQLIKEG